MAVMKVKKDRRCNQCKSPAKIWDKNKWWCGVDFYTRHGLCKNNKEKK